LQIADCTAAKRQIADCAAAKKWAACLAITQRRNVQLAGTRLGIIPKTNQTPRTSLHSNFLQNISKVRERFNVSFSKCIGIEGEAYHLHV